METDVMQAALAQMLPVAVVTLLAVISPGPDFAMVTRVSLAGGRRAGLLAALGIACGVSVHVTYTVLGFGWVVHALPQSLDILRYAGAAWLMWIGVQGLRSRPQAPEEAGEQAVLSGWVAWRSGALCNALNPKTALFFIALFSQGIDPSTPLSVQVGFGVFIALAHLLWFAVVAVGLTHPALTRRIQRIRHRVEQGVGLCLIGLGLRLALV
ncbi:LysE family translocator [Novispirillum itersonii]|uniref:Threonine/homoserine/homoserine lactone efflux protein n=1 Tax=Novispirillum itersonii TaxID=189 RepID=A0A7X0DN28_NOVIT|nr:LysE family translocator [Novispirillum itersonii]MBB6211666.1 threonine/homoserine/homoserine lactone efflux protein [Novispirillum itersonii]